MTPRPELVEMAKEFYGCGDKHSEGCMNFSCVLGDWPCDALASLLQSAVEGERVERGPDYPAGIVFWCKCGQRLSEEPTPFAGAKRCSCGMEFVGEVYFQMGLNISAIRSTGAGKG